MTDNDTRLASVEFKEFLTKVGVEYHKFRAPYTRLLSRWEISTDSEECFKISWSEKE